MNDVMQQEPLITNDVSTERHNDRSPYSFSATLRTSDAYMMDLFKTSVEAIQPRKRDLEDISLQIHADDTGGRKIATLHVSAFTKDAIKNTLRPFAESGKFSPAGLRTMLESIDGCQIGGGRSNRYTG